MVLPVFCTLTTALPPSCASRMPSIPPSGQNLMALSTRLYSTCWMPSRSARVNSARSGRFTLTCKRRLLIFCSNEMSTSLMISAISKRVLRDSSTPFACRRDTSSILRTSLDSLRTSCWTICI